MKPRFSNRTGGLHPSAIREILKVTADPGVISFAAGNPAPETFPHKEMSILAEEIFLSRPGEALQYGVSEGYGPLIETTFARIKKKYNIGKDFDNLIMLSGGQQGIELSAKILLNEDDAVICEQPSFIGALNALRSYNARLLGIPGDEYGIDIELLEKKLKEDNKIKLIYVIPDFQNPTGAVMSLERRIKLLELANRYDLMILEDSPYVELRYDGEDVPTIKSMDDTGRVIYCGSYSKTIAPGIRLGFVCAHESVIQKLTVVKQVSDVHSNLFFQILVNEYLSRYDFEEHIQVCRNICRKKRDRLHEGLSKHIPQASWNVPKGGLFLWCEMGMDTMVFCAKAGQKKVACVPGASFLVDETKTSSAMRLNFSLPSLEKIDEGCLRLGMAMREFEL